jgi:hypothetical protein
MDEPTQPALYGYIPVAFSQNMHPSRSGDTAQFFFPRLGEIARALLSDDDIRDLYSCDYERASMHISTSLYQDRAPCFSSLCPAIMTKMSCIRINPSFTMRRSLQPRGQGLSMRAGFEKLPFFHGRYPVPKVSCLYAISRPF